MADVRLPMIGLIHAASRHKRLTTPLRLPGRKGQEITPRLAAGIAHSEGQIRPEIDKEFLHQADKRPATCNGC